MVRRLCSALLESALVERFQEVRLTSWLCIGVCIPHAEACSFEHGSNMRVFYIMEKSFGTSLDTEQLFRREAVSKSLSRQYGDRF